MIYEVKFVSYNPYIRYRLIGHIIDRTTAATCFVMHQLELLPLLSLDSQIMSFDFYVKPHIIYCGFLQIHALRRTKSRFFMC